MMRDREIRYVIETENDAPVVFTPMEWRVRAVGQRRGMGRPTDANLAKEMKALNASMEPGGTNAHLAGDRHKVRRARIVDTRTGDVVATWEEAEG